MWGSMKYTLYHASELLSMAIWFDTYDAFTDVSGSLYQLRQGNCYLLATCYFRNGQEYRAYHTLKGLSQRTSSLNLLLEITSPRSMGSYTILC